MIAELLFSLVFTLTYVKAFPIRLTLQFQRRFHALTDGSEPPEPSSFPDGSFDKRSFFRHEIIHESTKPGSRARVGRIHTPHGIVDTPGFVAVATNGALKALEVRDAEAAGQQMIFCNRFGASLDCFSC